MMFYRRKEVGSQQYQRINALNISRPEYGTMVPLNQLVHHFPQWPGTPTEDSGVCKLWPKELDESIPWQAPHLSKEI